MYTLQDVIENQDKWSLWADEYESLLKAQISFPEFVRQAWPYIHGPAKPYVDGWHLGALGEHLEGVSRFEIRKLIVNYPPRTGKSTVLAVCWPAWLWLQAPHTQFYFSSHSLLLTVRDSVYCRRLIESEWYQRRWGHIFRLLDDQNTKAKFENNRNGSRSSASINSKVMGHGGDILVMDDPNTVKDVESEVQRQNVNDFLAGGWSTRVNNPKKSAMIISQQRTHQSDASGFTMENDRDGEWTRLILPMEFESKRRCRTIILPSTKGQVWEDPRKEEGELLWAAMMGPKEVKSLKNSLLTEYRIAGQLQQRPAPQEGGLLKKKYFRLWNHEKMPKFFQTIQSWDTALTEDDRRKSAYSACTTWGVFRDDNQILNVIALGMYRARVDYPDLRKIAKRLYLDYRDTGVVEIKTDALHRPDIVLVESKSSGISLISDFRRMGIMAFGFNPDKYGDKNARVERISDMLEGGRVWVPSLGPDFIALKPFANDLVEICSVFPNSDARDVVDSMTQVLLRLKYGGYLTHPEDEDFKSSGTIKPTHGFYGATEDEY